VTWNGDTRPRLRTVRTEAYASLPSTQQLLKERIRRGEGVDGLVVRAREQTAGLGRHGKRWAGPPGGSYQSVAFADPTGRLRRTHTALAVAIGIAEALRAAGALVSVKWPNDLYSSGGKLGGVLSEYVRGHLVVGIGINVANEVPAGARALGGWDVSTVDDLALDGAKRGLEDLVLDEPAGAPAHAPAHEVEVPGPAEGNGSPPTSEAMAASALGPGAGRRLADRYAALDLLAGARVVVATAAGEVVGVARGVDELGSLLVLGPSGVERIMSGTVLSWRSPAGRAPTPR